MAIAYDSFATAQTDGTTTLSWSHTCTGTGLLLFVGVAGTNSSELSGGSVKYGSKTMTQIGFVYSDNNSGDGVGGIALYGLIAPATGANTVTVTLNNANEMTCGSVSYSGCDQVTGWKNPNTAYGAPNAGTGIITGTLSGVAAGDLTVAAACYGSQISSGATGNSRWILANTSQDSGSSNAAMGDSTTGTVSWSSSAADWFGWVGAEIIAGSSSANASVTGATAACAVTVLPGSVTATRSAGITGTPGAVTATATAGSVTATTSVSTAVAGQAASALAAAVPGAVATTSSAAVSGSPGLAGVSALPGSISGNTVINGDIANALVEALPGSVAGSASVSGPAASVVTSAPAGGASATSSVTVPGAIALVQSGAVPGQAAATSSASVSLPPAGITVAAIAGMVLAGNAAAVTGTAAGILAASSPGTVTATSTALVSGQDAQASCTAVPGRVSASGSTGVQGTIAGIAVSAIAGTVSQSSGASIPGQAGRAEVSAVPGGVEASSSVSGPDAMLFIQALPGQVRGSGITAETKSVSSTCLVLCELSRATTIGCSVGIPVSFDERSLAMDRWSQMHPS